jgi:hypothetical protein
MNNEKTEEKLNALFAAIDAIELIRSRTMLDMSSEDASEFRKAQATLESAAVSVAWEMRSNASKLRAC